MTEEETIEEIKQRGNRWREYMNKQMVCPNNHALQYIINRDFVIPICAIVECDYYDYSNYKHIATRVITERH